MTCDGDRVTVHSLVAAVPFPSVTRPVGKEVGRPLVPDPLGEPQQHAAVVVPDGGAVSGAVSRRRRQVGT